MKKYFTILLLTFVSLFACKEIVIDPENGIRATGDYAGLLTKRIYPNAPISNTVLWEVTSITDSTNIIYPTFALTLNETKGALVVQPERGKPLQYYYAVSHKINVKSSNTLEISDITFLSGGGISADNQIITPDNTKTVILNGKLKL